MAIINDKDYLLSSYNYPFEEKLIAQSPIEPGHNAKLMVIGKESIKFESFRECRIWDIKDILKKNDLLVFNNTKVLKARLKIYMQNGKKGELLLLEPLIDGKWLCLVKPGKKIQPGNILFMELHNHRTLELKVIEKHDESGGRVIQFPVKYSERESIESLLEVYGDVPLPPYIKPNSSNIKKYQTQYALKPGAVAAPTAGLHFTTELLDELQSKGVSSTSITLHVGLGTFRPLKQENLSNLKLHSEWVEVNSDVIESIKKCRAKGGNVFAVGTTSVRALESAFKIGGNKLTPIRCKVDLVIQPGYKFGVVDGLLTNFHLPKSSLLLLVSAFIGRERLMFLYKRAIKNKYRFFSYGDAMLIKPKL